VFLSDEQNYVTSRLGDSSVSVQAPSASNVKRQRVECIRHAGLVDRFDKLCSSANIFQSAESSSRSRSAASTKAYCHMQHRFISWAKQNSPGARSELELILCAESPFDFAKLLQKTFKPFTVKNHASAMCALIELIMCNNEVKSAFGFRPHMKASLQAACESWSKIKAVAQRQGRAGQREKTRSGKFQNAPILLILEFLKKYAPICEKFCEDPEAEIGDGSLRALTICVCALYMCLHGQRLCAVLNLTQSELRDAICTNSRYILRIHQHKSFRHHGPSAIALRKHQYQLLQAMADLYGQNGNVFPSDSTGKACKHLFAPVNEFIKKKCIESQDITFNLFRKTVETNAFLVQSRGGKDRENINTYLCHGKSVTALHYAFKTDEEVVNQARSVEAVIAGLAALDIVREKRVILPNPLGK